MSCPVNLNEMLPKTSQLSIDWLACARRVECEDAEIAFCEQKRLHMSSLRMTWEAKVQLKDILSNAGFPDGQFPGRVLPVL